MSGKLHMYSRIKWRVYYMGRNGRRDACRHRSLSGFARMLMNIKTVEIIAWRLITRPLTNILMNPTLYTGFTNLENCWKLDYWHLFDCSLWFIFACHTLVMFKAKPIVLVNYCKEIWTIYWRQKSLSWLMSGVVTYVVNTRPTAVSTKKSL